MVTKVIMPKFGLQMKDGIIVEWLKKEGDEVKKGELLLVVETDKANIEVEAPASGILKVIIEKEKSLVPVGGLLAMITNLGEELPEIDEHVKMSLNALEPQQKKTETIEKERARAVAGRKMNISPLARRLAEEHGIDMTAIEGSGPGGRIVKHDIMKTIEKTGITPEFQSARIDAVIPLTIMRKRIAQRLSESHATNVHVTHVIEVDTTDLLRLCQASLVQTKEGSSIRVSINDILVKTLAIALKKYPLLNSTLDKEEVKVFGNVNLGVAISINEGLIVPVIRNAEQKSIVEIAKELEELIEKARKGTLSLQELTGGTFTLSNLGMYGISIFTPIINPPQSAILGVGRISDKPVVIEGEVAIRSIMPLSLSFDHRIIDGALAAQFLQELKRILEEPDSLFA